MNDSRELAGRGRRSGRRDLRPMSTVTVVFRPDGGTALEIGWGFEEMFSASSSVRLTATAAEPVQRWKATARDSWKNGWLHCLLALSAASLACLTNEVRELEGAVATTGGNHAVSPRHCR